MNVEQAVLARYSDGAHETQAELCCPVDYDASLLKILPEEILQRDYGCGDPSRYVRPGDVVLDLGSGGGKICYMAAQMVGPEGTVIGIDMNDDMLALARKYQSAIQESLPGVTLRFVKGYIQNLALDVDAMERHLASSPVNDAVSLGRLEAWKREQSLNSPLIADNSVDLVISNCVLNLVSDTEKSQMLREIFRVLKPGGRVAISDIVSDEIAPEHLKADPELWSGCISGAYQEFDFSKAFADAGFVAIAYDKWDTSPWRVVEGIEFRSVTLTAVKPSAEPCLDKGHAVIYRGPYASVFDDEGHVYYRGERMAVCERTYQLITDGPYRADFIGLPPAQVIEPLLWCAPSGTRRGIRENKGVELKQCGSIGCC